LNPQWLIPFCAAAAVVKPLTAAQALVLGACLALSFGNPYAQKTKGWIHTLLTTAVMGLGLEMNLNTVARVGLQGFGYTAAGIAFAFAVGTLLRKSFEVNRDVSLLITTGTAICGGSAIAAVAPVIRAKHHEVTVSLAIVFLLNALALVVFPPLGQHLGLSQHQFGLWSALAIHDTSSVVGATMQYGTEALQTGTTVKLARALWIVPVTLALGALYRPKGEEGSAAPAKRPWFILGFLAAAALVTYLPQVRPVTAYLGAGAKRLLVLTLFLIGSGLTKDSLKAAGSKPLLMGATLWLLTATTTLAAILGGWIR
jgi:uncharacterized integral membrane protein (TIGR00698 family)